jgi:hypothetical protein
MIPVSGNKPTRISCGLDEFRRHRIAGQPKLYRLVVGGISNAKNFSRRIGRVAMGADVFQNRATARFIIAVKHMLRDINMLMLNTKLDIDIADGLGLMHGHDPDRDTEQYKGK